MSVLLSLIAFNLSALSNGPARLDPNIMRAFSCAVAGGAEGKGAGVAAVSTSELELLASREIFILAVSVVRGTEFLRAAAGFLTVLRGDLGDDVGGSSGLVSAMG
jgi:hypothetical protein